MSCDNPKPNNIFFDDCAFINNFRLISSMISPAKVLAVIKANGYGLGLANCYKALCQISPSWIGVNDVDEAIELRKLGFKKNILALGPSFSQDFDLLHQHDITFCLGSFDLLDHWLKSTHPPKCHLKLDCGLSRQGFFIDDLKTVWKKILDHQSYNPNTKHKPTGLMTHFSNELDTNHHQSTKPLTLQHNKFVQGINLSKQYITNDNFLYHCGSSYSSIYKQICEYDLLRVGLVLFGITPKFADECSVVSTTNNSDDRKINQQKTNLRKKLQPVVKWYSRVIQIKKLKSGTAVGYRGMYKACDDITIAILSTGYYHGYPRIISDYDYNLINTLEKTTNIIEDQFYITTKDLPYVLISGYKCPIIGDISMTMMMVMLPKSLLIANHQQIFFPNHKVTLVGSEYNPHFNQQFSITIDDLSRWSGIIPYEILTGLKTSLVR